MATLLGVLMLGSAPFWVRAAALLVGLLTLSGCGAKANAGPADISTPVDATAVDDLDDTKGTIAGYVLDEEALPLPATQVTVLRTNRFNVTDQLGYFEIRGLAPTTYDLEVRLGENDPVVTQAVVTAGETTEVEIIVALTRPVVEVPYYVLQMVNGHMGCNVAGQECPGYPSPNEKRSFEHAFEGRPVSLLYEMTWQRFGPAPPPEYGDNGQPGWIHRWDLEAKSNVLAYGASGPPYLRATAVVPEGTKAESPMAVTVKSHPAGFLQNPGIATEQAFTVYMTSFHLRDDSATFCGAAPEFCPEGTTPAT